MGSHLACNMLEKGFAVAGFDGDQKCRDLCATHPELLADSFSLFSDLDTLIAALKPPRILILMITAGTPVDHLLAQCSLKLTRGDILMDGGNSHFTDTIRRHKAMAVHGIAFFGVGISGGAQGARHGPAIMLGGDRVPDALWHLLQTISARHQSQPCLIHAGPDGAGHFVKMVHNSIEYADMQLLAESQFLLHNLMGLDYPDQARVFETWNQGDLAGYLTRITAQILRKIDPETGCPALDILQDQVGHKGTGLWAVQAALELGVSTPNLTQALDARVMSGMQAERKAVRKRWPVHATKVKIFEQEWMIPALAHALLAARITVFAQGFKLLAAASQHYDWALDLGAIAACWRGGCILQGTMPEWIHVAFRANPGLEHLWLDPVLGQKTAAGFDLGRRVLAIALGKELPVPNLTTALSCFDTFRQQHLWTRMVAAQRDCFGSHGFLRTDREGSVTWDWTLKQ